MMLRVLVLAGGLTGAAGLSQFPEFSQQYVQRLGGAVDALGRVLAEFDASASAAGLDRDAALRALSGSAFLDRRGEDMARLMTRHARLESELLTLQAAGPFMRAYHAARLDREIARAALAHYRPALPLDFAGFVFAGTGFVLGCGLIGSLAALLPGRRRARAR